MSHIGGKPVFGYIYQDLNILQCRGIVDGLKIALARRGATEGRQGPNDDRGGS